MSIQCNVKQQQANLRRNISLLSGNNVLSMENFKIL